MRPMGNAQHRIISMKYPQTYLVMPFKAPNSEGMADGLDRLGRFYTDETSP